MGFEPAVAAARRLQHLSMTTRDEELRRTLSTLVAFDASHSAMPVVSGAVAAIVPPVSELRTTPVCQPGGEDANPFPVEGLFSELTSSASTRELLAMVAEQRRLMGRVLAAVRQGTGTLGEGLVVDLELAINAELQLTA